MALYKNKASQKLAIYVHDTGADAPKTGDAANITAQISKDGGACAATNDTNPTELDATDAPGIYLFDLTQAETNADLVIVSAVSSTSDVSIEPVIVYTEPEMRAANAVQISGDSTAATNAKNGWTGLVTTGIAQTSTSTTITLASGASSTDDFYNLAAISIVSGTGAGQTRQITDYVGSTKVATVDTAWATNPSSDSVYQIIGRIV